MVPPGKRQIGSLFSIACAAFLFFWGAPCFASDSPEKAQQVRSLLSELIAASSSPPQEKASAIRRTFLNHPEVFGFYAEVPLDHLLTQSGLEGIHIPLSNDKQLLQELQRLAKNEFHDRLLDVGLREEVARIVNAVPDVQADKPLGRVAISQVKHLSKTYSELSPENRARLLQLIPDQRLIEASERIDELLLQTRFSDTEAIAQLTRAGAINYDSIRIPPEEISEFIGKYFAELDLAARRRIIRGLLELPAGASAEMQLSVFVQRAGPALQKFLQLAGRGAKSPAMKILLEQLHANVLPFPSGEARAAVEKSLGVPIETLFQSFDNKPLASGTVGQVHRAVLKNGEEVVIKVRRPGIVEQVSREMEIARKISADTPVAWLVEKLHQSLARELDFTIEAANLDKAVKSYSNPKKGIEVPARIRDFPVRDDVLVVQMAKGQHPGNMKTMLLRQGEALSHLLEQWIDVAIFQDGFFHSDLHPGNIFLERVKTSRPDLWVHPIDAGNTGQLTLLERRSFVRLSLSAMTGSTARMMEAATPLVPGMTPSQKEAIMKSLENVNFSKMATSERLETFISTVLAHGVDMEPADLLNFHRGKLMLEGQLADINTRLNHLDPKKKLKRFDPEEIYTRVAARRLGVELPKKAVSAKARANSVASVSDLSRALISQSGLVDAYFSLANSCLMQMLMRLF